MRWVGGTGSPARVWPAADMLQGATSVAGRIGPNAITRVVEALGARHGELAAADCLRAAGLAAFTVQAPVDMVSEDHVAVLQAYLYGALDADDRVATMREAGRLTGDYLLSNRIPKLAQAVLKRLPAGVSGRVLAGAVARHAWTFAGSGQFMHASGRPLLVAIEHCPLCSRIASQGPVCDYYAATFERIFGELTSRSCRVEEIECEGAGGAACRFRIDF